jgi:hypothetical protein
MRLEDLFSDDLRIEYELQQRYIDCLALLNEYNSKTESEVLADMLAIWETWDNGKGKAEFLLMAGMDMQKAHNLLSSVTPNRIKFEDYVRFKAVGKDYAVIANKYKLDKHTQSMRGRVKRLKKQEEKTLEQAFEDVLELEAKKGVRLDADTD